MKHMPSQLSGGQQQRVAIARAIAGDPAFLLADEPTGNLDSLMARQVMDLLEQINDIGTTILLVTHDPELARRAQRNVHLVDGQLSDFRPYEPRPASAVSAARFRALKTQGTPRMLGYYAHLALRSFRRNPGLTALMVLAIALGIAVCIMTLTVYHAMAGNPIWWKSERLYAVTMDNWDPNQRYDVNDKTRPPQMTYKDTAYLFDSNIPRAQGWSASPPPASSAAA